MRVVYNSLTKRQSNMQRRLVDPSHMCKVRLATGINVNVDLHQQHYKCDQHQCVLGWTADLSTKRPGMCCCSATYIASSTAIYHNKTYLVLYF